MKVKFIELFDDCTSKGTKIKKEDYLNQGEYPIIDQGQEQVAGFSNDGEGLFFDVPAIIFGDHTRIIKYIDEPFYLGADGVKVLRCKREDVNYKYLYYALKRAKIPNTGYNRHFKWLKEVSINYPSVTKQEEIVNILDNISLILDYRMKQLDELDNLIKSQFVEMFGDLKLNTKNWKIETFKRIASIDTSMVKDLEKYADYPHIGIDSIEKETGELKGFRTVKEDGVISGKYLFTPKHIIYSKIRPNLNKVALPNFVGVCSADAYPILPVDNVCNREFLCYAMRSDVFLSYILAFSSRTNLPKVNKQQVEGFELPVPPIELQNHFATFVQQVDKLKFAIQKSLDETQTLFDALMQKYFG